MYNFKRGNDVFNVILHESGVDFYTDQVLLMRYLFATGEYYICKDSSSLLFTDDKIIETIIETTDHINGGSDKNIIIDNLIAIRNFRDETYKKIYKLILSDINIYRYSNDEHMCELRLNKEKAQFYLNDEKILVFDRINRIYYIYNDHSKVYTCDDDITDDADSVIESLHINTDKIDMFLNIWRNIGLVFRDIYRG